MKNSNTFLLIMFLLTKATDIYAANNRQLTDDAERESWSIPANLMNGAYQDKYPEEGILYDKKVKISDLSRGGNFPEKWGFFDDDDHYQNRNDDGPKEKEEQREEKIKFRLLIKTKLITKKRYGKNTIQCKTIEGTIRKNQKKDFYAVCHQKSNRNNYDWEFKKYTLIYNKKRTLLNKILIFSTILTGISTIGIAYNLYNISTFDYTSFI